jgi:hypothetical protein
MFKPVQSLALPQVVLARDLLLKCFYYMIELIVYNPRFARDVVAERFGANKVIRKDMLGSFLAHGLTQEQLESETVTQMYQARPFFLNASSTDH